MKLNEEVLKHIERSREYLEKKVERGEDFECSSAEEELKRVNELYKGLLWYTNEYG